MTKVITHKAKRYGRLPEEDNREMLEARYWREIAYMLEVRTGK